MVRAYTMVMPGWETCSVAVDIITLGENSSHLVICSLASPPRLWVSSSSNSQCQVLWSRAPSSWWLLFVSPVPSSSPGGSAQCRLRPVVLLVVFRPGWTAVSSISTLPNLARVTKPWHRQHVRQQALLFSGTVGCLTCFLLVKCDFPPWSHPVPFRIGDIAILGLSVVESAIFTLGKEEKELWGVSPACPGCTGGRLQAWIKLCSVLHSWQTI